MKQNCLEDIFAHFGKLLGSLDSKARDPEVAEGVLGEVGPRYLRPTPKNP